MQIKNNIKELWNYISNELGQLHKASTINREQIVNSLVMVANNKWWLLSDVEKLAKVYVNLVIKVSVGGLKNAVTN